VKALQAKNIQPVVPIVPAVLVSLLSGDSAVSIVAGVPAVLVSLPSLLLRSFSGTGIAFQVLLFRYLKKILDIRIKKKFLIILNLWK
jgi:hypothetical protein